MDFSSIGRVIKVKLSILRYSSRGSFYRPSKVVQFAINLETINTGQSSAIVSNGAVNKGKS